MNRASFLLISAALAALVSGNGAPAQESAQAASGSAPSFILAPRVTGQGQASITVSDRFDFGAALSLSLRTDPRFIPSAELTAMIEGNNMVDGAGRPVGPSYALDLQHDLVIGSTGGAPEITHISQGKDGLQVRTLIRDEAGALLAPAKDSLAAYRTDGQRLCLETERIADVPERSPLAITILLDASGSMKDFAAAAQLSAFSFASRLPEHAQCSVLPFSDAVHARQSCQSVRDGLLEVSFGGGTDLLGALRAESIAMSGLGDDVQKGIIVITDGRQTKKNVLHREGLLSFEDTRIFVTYLGTRDDRWLKRYADSYLRPAENLSEVLGEYFTALGQSYASQSVLTVTECPAHGDQP